MPCFCSLTDVKWDHTKVCHILHPIKIIGQTETLQIQHFNHKWQDFLSDQGRGDRTCSAGPGKVWPLLNFHELHPEEFPDFSLLSKNPLKLNKSKMNQIILIMFCRNGGNTSLRQLSSENQYNYVYQAVLTSD